VPLQALISFMFSNIGPALRIIRQARGISQSRLALISKTGRSQLARYEAGKDLMRLDTLEKLLEALEVEPEQLFRLVRSLDESLSPRQPGVGERIEVRALEDAFQNLRSAIDQLQQAVQRCLSPGVVRLSPARATGDPADRKGTTPGGTGP
jgi:transcriptional regulator with XRE-family HTH domain